MEKSMTTNENFCRLVSWLICCLILLPAVVHAEDVKKICVMPFAIFSSGDKQALQETLYKNLSEELKKERRFQVIPADSYLKTTFRIDEKQAILNGKALGSDLVVIGSLTQLGEAVSIDARIIDIEKGSVIATVSSQGKGIDHLGPIVANLKNEMLVKIGFVEKIAKIEIKGNRKISSAAILNKIKSKEGNNFSETDVTDDIKTIFKMGYFLDVKAETASTPEGRIITFIVQEKGLISEVVIKGNKALSKDEIVEVMATKSRQNLNQEQIKTDVQKIKALYDSKGYYNAEIKDTVESDGEKDFRVILDIKEHEKLYIKSITFEGNVAFTSKELKNMMNTSEAGLFHFFTDSGVLKRDQLKKISIF